MNAANQGASATASKRLLAQRLPLLSRMSADLERRGYLRRETATWMYTVYATHVAATVGALTRPPTMPVPAVVARTLGSAAMATGAALCVAGMSRFNGTREVSGLTSQPLLTTGVYACTRNPQYLGYIVAHGGLAVARRNLAALALTGVLGAVYQVWVPVEERHLTATLGAPYEAYMSRTRRWLGRG